MVELMNGIVKGISPTPNFDDSVKNQAVLAAVEQSVNTKNWVKISKLFKSNNNLINL
jgi:hypothetical protein